MEGPSNKAQPTDDERLDATANDADTDILNIEDSPLATGVESMLQIDLLLHTSTPDHFIKLGSFPTNETFHSMRSILSELQPTAHLTSYKIIIDSLFDENQTALAPLDAILSISEYVELSTYIPSNCKLCILKIIPELYDAKKIRFHIKRTRDLLHFPLLNIAILVNKNNEPVVSTSVPETVPVSSENIPNVESELKPPAEVELFKQPALDRFYHETLFRSGKPNNYFEKNKCEHPNQIIKSIIGSGWNPPTHVRKLQGDLFYLEIHTSNEGVSFVTATISGFYVNRSNRQHFDPRPNSSWSSHSSHPLFCHNLLDLIIRVSDQFHQSWNQICRRHPDPVVQDDASCSNALSLLASFHQEGRGDNTFAKFQWNCLPLETYPNLQASYDLYRVQSDLVDVLIAGSDDVGVIREWNEEIQSVRSLPSNNINDRILKARLEYKIITEFGEACKILAVAVSEGTLAPYNVTEPDPQAYIFVYNGIFLTRAIDLKDSFKLCNGNEATWKSTGRDLNNHKIIQSLGVLGLHTVLLTTVDYKGDRFVGQSIIPGILTQNENNAYLLYGALEKGKNITVKNNSMELMKTLCANIFMKPRNIPNIPIQSVADELPVESLEAKGELVGQQTVKIDEVDNVIAEIPSTVPHVGPIECKVLRGADAKVYILEVPRLTPRDANFVKGEKGTGKIPSELLSKTDDDVITTHVIRRELITMYVESRMDTRRQELVLEISKNSTIMASNAKENDREADNASPTESNPEKAAAELETIQKSYLEKFKAITPESVGLEINPNVFFDFPCDVNKEVALRDEEDARKLAIFLWDEVLPTITKHVREGSFVPRDSGSIVNHLHQMGVNIRYIGELIRLARLEELDDEQTLSHGKQNVYMMPKYWFEMLMVEVLARSVKSLLRQYFQSDLDIASAPATFIALVLNVIFERIFWTSGSTPNLPETSIDPSNDSKNDSTDMPQATATEVINGATIAGSKSNKKKKKRVYKACEGPGVPQSEPHLVIPSIHVNGVSKAPLSSNDRAYQTFEKSIILRKLTDLIAQKFCLTVPFDEAASTASGEEDPATQAELALKESISLTFLRSRLSPLMLLRRICQLSGIRVESRNYSFFKDSTDKPSEGQKAESRKIFSSEDIMGLVPIVKSCEPDVLFPEVHELLNTSIHHLNSKNYSYAFELAQQATNLMSQITGPIHVQAAKANYQVSSVLLTAGDYPAATQVTSKNLSVAAQLNGLDCEETFLQHIQLASIFMETKQYLKAIQHLLSAKYIIEVTGGPRHPDLSAIYIKLSIAYHETGDFAIGMTCLTQSRNFTTNLLTFSNINVMIAERLFNAGYVHQAVEEHKGAYKILKELCKETDENLMEAKKTLEKYLRAANEVNIAISKSQEQFWNGLKKEVPIEAAKKETEKGVEKGAEVVDSNQQAILDEELIMELSEETSNQKKKNSNKKKSNGSKAKR